MANVRALVGSSSVPKNTADGRYMDLRCLRDGVLPSVDWYDALAFEGRVFVANGGTASSPATFAGAYDADGPDLSIDIPDGIAVIPLYISVHLETTGNSMFEVIAIASKIQTAVSAYTGGAVVTPQNYRLDSPIATRTTCHVAVDATSCTDPHTAGNFVEFYRSGVVSDPDAAAANPAHFYWSAKKDGPPPVILDGGSIVVYVGGTSGVGFITAAWAELPENFFK